MITLYVEVRDDKDHYKHLRIFDVTVVPQIGAILRIDMTSYRIFDIEYSFSQHYGQEQASQSATAYVQEIK